jgi:hypothetical protein
MKKKIICSILVAVPASVTLIMPFIALSGCGNGQAKK